MTATQNNPMSLSGVWGGAWGRPVAMTAHDMDSVLSRIAFMIQQNNQAGLIDILKQSALTEADLRAALWQISLLRNENAQLRAYIDRTNEHLSRMAPLANVPAPIYPSSTPPIQPVQYQSNAAKAALQSTVDTPQLPPVPPATQ